MGCAAFWATFSQTHLVTLLPLCSLEIRLAAAVVLLSE
jgi:hypothetical protein